MSIGGGGGGTYPQELVAWCQGLELSEVKVDALLSFLCSDDMGFSEISELASLDEEDMATATAIVPKAKRKKFADSIAAITGGAGTAAAATTTTAPVVAPIVQQQLPPEEQKKVDEDLLTAAKNGNEEGVRDLLNRRANPNGAKDVR